MEWKVPLVRRVHEGLLLVSRGCVSSSVDFNEAIPEDNLQKESKHGTGEYTISTTYTDLTDYAIRHKSHG